MTEQARSQAPEGAHRTPTRKHSAVMREHLPLAGRRVADVGCGNGALSRFMAREGAAAVGVEIAYRALERALAAETQEGRAREDRAPEEGPRYLCARGEALPFGAATLDAVVFFNSLHHVPVEDQRAALAEAARALLPGGLLYVVEPLAEGPGHALMLPIEDETEVRARAYEALQAVGADGLFEPLLEETYDAPYRVASFETWKADIVAVDPRRRATVEAQGPQWEQDFLAVATPAEGGGFRMTTPSRLNLLRKR